MKRQLIKEFHDVTEYYDGIYGLTQRKEWIFVYDDGFVELVSSSRMIRDI